MMKFAVFVMKLAVWPIYLMLTMKDRANYLESMASGHRVEYGDLGSVRISKTHHYSEPPKREYLTFGEYMK